MNKKQEFVILMQEETGYKFITTFWQDFSIADKFGIDAIKDTYTRAVDEWKHNYKYMTELIMVLNWKSFEWYNKNKNYSQTYGELYYELDAYCIEHFSEEEQKYYFSVTD